MMLTDIEVIEELDTRVAPAILTGTPDQSTASFLD
jgi:hypothetical protein